MITKACKPFENKQDYGVREYSHGAYNWHNQVSITKQDDGLFKVTPQFTGSYRLLKYSNDQASHNTSGFSVLNMLKALNPLTYRKKYNAESFNAPITLTERDLALNIRKRRLAEWKKINTSFWTS